MWASVDHGLVFIHVHKSAGTSLTNALMRTTGIRGNTFAGVDLENHMTAQAFLRQFPQSEGFRFCAVVRNPWDRLVSNFYMVRDRMVVRRPREVALKERFLGYADFTAFVDDLYRTYLDPEAFRPYTMLPDYPKPGAINYNAQWTWLLRDGELVVDVVGRFEELDQAAARIFAAAGLATPTVPHRNVTEHPPYRECYTARSAGQVAEIYARDIELFGYEL